MMPNVTRGTRMAGLMTYLIGPGKTNEHTEPHLVAGDDALMVWHDDNELNRDSALEIARHLDLPRRALDVDVSGGHVWHCSLSLRSDEGLLTDQRWGEIARDFVAAMEFDDNHGTKAPCRWVAVRHGVSENGNDHIHLGVNLVREDGTKAFIHNDFKRAQNAARALEAKHGLEELESVRAERATRGYDPAEREAQARSRARGKYERTRSRLDADAPAWAQLDSVDRQGRIAAELRTDQPRYVLSVRVRGCATASESEAEFVRRMRGEGVLVRPRYADGRTDVVTGYSVAERPQFGERPIWYGGGHLARDLTLPRLREQWPDTPYGAGEAVAEWNAAIRGRRVVAPGREETEINPTRWAEARAEIDEFVKQVRSIPLEDRDAWARVARQTSGALAAWSNATEESPGDLAKAAEALSRSAQTYRSEPALTNKAGRIRLAGTAMVLASAMKGGKGTTAQTAMIISLIQLAQAVHDAARAAGQARHAQMLASDIRARLSTIRAQLPPQPAAARAVPAAVKTAERAPHPEIPEHLSPKAKEALRLMHVSQAKDATQAVKPVPEKIEPTEVKRVSVTQRERDIER